MNVQSKPPDLNLKIGNQEHKNAVPTPKIDDKETYLEISNTIMKTEIAIKKIKGQ